METLKKYWWLIFIAILVLWYFSGSSAKAAPIKKTDDQPTDELAALAAQRKELLRPYIGRMGRLALPPDVREQLAKIDARMKELSPSSNYQTNVSLNY